MGKPGIKTMEERSDSEQCEKNQGNTGGSGGPNSLQRTVSTPAPRNTQTQTCHLSASASSPSLLAGCADVNTHAGAEAARHIHNHNVQVSQIPDAPLSPIPDSPVASPSVASFPPFPSPGPQPSSNFVTPPRRAQRSTAPRPRSAPAHHLERISGTLLRLIGDHYLCCECGRELRTIGDQLTVETNLQHIRNYAISQLDMTNNDGHSGS